MSNRGRLDNKPCSSLNPRFGPQEKNLPGLARTIEPSVSRCPPAACAYSHPDTCLSTKFPASPPLVAHSGRVKGWEFCVEHRICNAVAGVSLSCSSPSFS